MTTGGATSAAIVDASGAKVTSSTGPKIWAFAVPAAGTYYLKVTAASGSFPSYTIALQP